MTEPERVVLCRYCRGCVRSFAANHPHADIDELRRFRWNGCCRYWLAKGIPAGAWN